MDLTHDGARLQKAHAVNLSGAQYIALPAGSSALFTLSNWGSVTDFSESVLWSAGGGRTVYIRLPGLAAIGFLPASPETENKRSKPQCICKRSGGMFWHGMYDCGFVNVYIAIPKVKLNSPVAVSR